MNETQIAELEAATAAAKQKAEENPDDASLQKLAQEAEAELQKAKEPSQDPLKSELDRVNKGKPEAVKLKNSLIGIARRARELGIDPLSVLNETGEDDDDDKPVTVSMLKQMEAEKAQKTALELAESIEDEVERELVKHHLENSIKPSGNPERDLKNAQAIANSARNAQIAEEAARGDQVRPNRSTPGQPARREEPFEPTPEERAYMKPPFNLSKEDILKARAKSQAKK